MPLQSFPKTITRILHIALKDIVFKEIEEYISTLNINDEFELYDAWGV